MIDQPQQPTWWRRNQKWAIPVALLGIVASCCGGVVMIFALVFGLLKNSDVYKEALATATADARVKQQLGEPIKAGMFVTGNINIQNDRGLADLSIPISGPKGSATIHIVAEKAAGKWTPSTLEVQPDDGSSSPIDLLDKPDAEVRPEKIDQ